MQLPALHLGDKPHITASRLSPGSTHARQEEVNEGKWEKVNEDENISQQAAQVQALDFRLGQTVG